MRGPHALSSFFLPSTSQRSSYTYQHNMRQKQQRHQDYTPKPNTEPDKMSHFTSSLEGMEIAIPPSSGNFEQETDEYGRTRKIHARRPLPPAPPPKVPPKSIARKPVGSPPERNNAGTPLPPYNNQIPASSKSLPPKPLRTQSPPLRRDRIDLPTGHNPTHKIFKVMGAEVDMHADRREQPSAPSSLQVPCSSSVYSHDEFHELSSQGTTMKLTGLPTLPRSAWPGCDSKTRHSSFEQQIPSSRDHHIHHRFSDARTAREYHRFASHHRPKTKFVGVDSELSNNRCSSISGDTPLSSHRCSPSQRLDIVDQGAFERPRQRSLESPYHEQRPNSAFDSDSDDDETAKIMTSILGFFSPRSDPDLAVKTKRQSYGKGIISILGRPREQSSQGQEEETGKEGKRMRRDVKLIPRGKVGNSGRLAE